MRYALLILFPMFAYATAETVTAPVVPAVSSSITIGDYKDWHVQIVTKKTAITEALGNPVAIITRPAQADGFVPAITVYKVAVPPKFNEEHDSSWRAIALHDRPNIKTFDRERILRIDSRIRYFASVSLETKAETLDGGYYMAFKAGSDIYYLKFLADRELYNPNIEAVRDFMRNTPITIGN